MSTYRVTIKYWDRHYGDGHVQFKRNFEARTSSKADQEAISILENALKTHSKPQGRIAEAWAERSERGHPSTLRKYDGSSGQWVQVNPVRPAVARESLRVADFSTLPDLVKHAKSDLGATHVSGQGAETRIYFPLGSGQYEEATVWQKGNYWHATGPGARQRVAKPPRDAKPITQQGMRWASEAPRAPRAPRYSAHQSEDNALIDFVFRGEEKIGYIAGPFSNSKGTVYKWKLYSIPNQKSLPFGMSGMSGEARSRQAALNALTGADKALTTRRAEHFPETVSEAPRRSSHKVPPRRK